MSPTLFHIVLLLTLHTAYAQSPLNMTILLDKVFATDVPTMTSNTVPKLCGIGRECVARHLCLANGVNKDGNTVISFRLDDEAECPFLQTCCAVGNQEPAELIKFGIVPADGRGHCGQRNQNGVIYVISELEDIETKFAEFPWMVALLKKGADMANMSKHEVFAGGSIIAPNVILTAAHSVKEADAKQQLIVRAGEWDLQTTDEALPHQERGISRIIRHEKFNPENGHNDIALLLLDSPLDLTQPNVAPICLPQANERSFDYTRCFATGWGKDRFGSEGRYRHTLKRVDVPILTNGACQTLLRQTVLGRHFELHESFICAGGEKDKDTCQGDGGSPLVCPTQADPQRYQQLGIVSWGIRCGEEDVPAAYASVRHLRKWLDGKLGELGVDSAYYTQVELDMRKGG